MGRGKKIGPILGTNIKKYFDSDYSLLKNNSYIGISRYLSYDRELYTHVINDRHDLEFSTVVRFAKRMDISIPSLFSRECMSELVVYRTSPHMYSLTWDSDVFLENFRQNIRQHLQNRNMPVSTLYEKDVSTVWWEENGSISKSSVHAFLSGSLKNPRISLLGWIALSLDYNWEDLGMMMLNKKFLEFDIETHKFKISRKKDVHPFLQPS